MVANAAAYVAYHSCRYAPGSSRTVRKGTAINTTKFEMTSTRWRKVDLDNGSPPTDVIATMPDIVADDAGPKSVSRPQQTRYADMASICRTGARQGIVTVTSSGRAQKRSRARCRNPSPISTSHRTAATAIIVYGNGGLCQIAFAPAVGRRRPKWTTCTIGRQVGVLRRSSAATASMQFRDHETAAPEGRTMRALLTSSGIKNSRSTSAS